MTEISNNQPEITPEFANKLLENGVNFIVYKGRVMEDENLEEWMEGSYYIVKEYLKLHEENQRLRDALEQIEQGYELSESGFSRNQYSSSDMSKIAEEALKGSL